MQFTVKFKQLTHHSPIIGDINVVLPEGWLAKYNRAFHIARTRDLMEYSTDYVDHEMYSELKITVTPGENVSAVNRIWVNVVMNTRSVPLCIPVTVLG